jgi:septal ring factor EnvC (AmiA/AmiB activator)
MTRRFWGVLATVAAMLASGAIAPAALAEDEPKPDQLKQMYQDTLAQLKNAQERKTQLAAENEQLKAKVAELEKQLAATQAKSAELEKQAAGFAEKTFFLRSHYAAWQEFLRRYPRFQIRWKVFLENDVLSPHGDMPALVDPEWPWSAQS